MKEPRFVVLDILWPRLETHLSGKVNDAGTTTKVLETVFWRAHTGSPWRAIPPAFGHWNSQFRRFHQPAKSHIFYITFIALIEDPDLEYALIDGTIVQLQQKVVRTKRGTQAQAIGGSHEHVKPPCVCRMLQHMNGMEHHEQDNKQVCARDPRTFRVDGFEWRGRV